MINLDIVRSLRVPLPTREEQSQLMVKHGAVMAHVEDAISVIVRQASLIEERKQALITAAVTGQFDVTTARKVSTT